MRVLLDTHTFLWANQDWTKLSQPAARALRAEDNQLFLSQVSVWELVIKARLGKLRLPHAAVEFAVRMAQANQIKLLPVGLVHLGQLESLPLHHRDPFDRMLVAQAQAESMPLVSHDQQLARYAVDIIW